MVQIWAQNANEETMSYTEQIRHPDGALNPAEEKERDGASWWWWVVAAMVALVLIGIYRPQWLEKIGVYVARSSGEALGGIANPMGWV